MGVIVRDRLLHLEECVVEVRDPDIGGCVLLPSRAPAAFDLAPAGAAIDAGIGAPLDLCPLLASSCDLDASDRAPDDLSESRGRESQS